MILVDPSSLTFTDEIHDILTPSVQLCKKCLITLCVAHYQMRGDTNFVATRHYFQGVGFVLQTTKRVPAPIGRARPYSELKLGT